MNFADQKVGEIVVNDYRTAEVFKSFGIDFCCGGKKLLSKVCIDKGLNYQQVEQALLQAMSQKEIPNEQEITQWPVDKLVDYIVDKHHTYVTKSLPVLLEFTAKIARVHGDTHPELFEVKKLFDDVAEELSFHMQKEEKILFPFIKNLWEAKENTMRIGKDGFGGTIQNPISVMEADHEEVGNLMAKIKELTSSYVFPENACNSYRFTFAKLKEFEEDLHQHIHLENNILFIKAIEIEKELLQ